MRVMPGELLLLSIASIAVAVAGFTGVTSTLVPPGGTWHPAMRVRQRAIVSTSFNVMFEALAPLIAFAWLDDARAAIAVAWLGVAVYASAVVVVLESVMAGLLVLRVAKPIEAHARPESVVEHYRG